MKSRLPSHVRKAIPTNHLLAFADRLGGGTIKAVLDRSKGTCSRQCTYLQDRTIYPEALHTETPLRVHTGVAAAIA